MSKPTEVHTEHLFKIIIVGNANVGKTNILLRYATGNYSERSDPTIGVDFKTKRLIDDGKIVNLQLWDTAGQERYRTIITNYYRGSFGVVLVFDLTSHESFLSIDDWMHEINTNLEHKNIILVGNKADIMSKRQVTEEDIKKMINKYNLVYAEVSAKTNKGIDDMFSKLIKMIFKDFVDEQKLVIKIKPEKYLKDKKKRTDESCC